MVVHHVLEFGVHEWLFATVYMIYVREIIAILAEICSLNDGWIGFVFLLKKMGNKLTFLQFSEWV